VWLRIALRVDYLLFFWIAGAIGSAVIMSHVDMIFLLLPNRAVLLAFSRRIFYNVIILPWYIGNFKSSSLCDCDKGEIMNHSDDERKRLDHHLIERMQTGARMEKRMVKVLKALAEYLDISLGDLLEGIVLHAFAGKAPFSTQTLEHIARLKEIYGMDYGVEASHRLREATSEQREEDDDAL
jgi:hypothetical protein